MALRTYAVLVEDTASDEATSFAVEASSPLIACTRAATRLFGPEAETRAVYGCAVCGAPLWEGEGLDSSGFRFCADCSPDDLESREEPEPIGLAVKTARVSATELALLPGDTPVGGVEVVVGDPDQWTLPGETYDDDAEARTALVRALRAAMPLDEVLGDLTVRDEAGAFFRYRLRPVAEGVDAEELAARGLIEDEDEDEAENENEHDEAEDAP